MNNNYKVYLHTNLTNRKKYVGITRVPVKDRWNNGNGYIENKKFYKDIQKYGWDHGFSHEILEENLSYKDARTAETNYIIQFDSVRNGYNNSHSPLGAAFQFDFNDFTPLDNPYVENTRKEYFTRIPNHLVQIDIRKEYNLHRVFYLIYILIDQHRNYEDKSYIVLSEIFDLCGYMQTRHKPKIFFEIIKCLLFMNESNLIRITSDFEIYNADYDDCIRLDIICANFDATDNFSIITRSQLNFIMNANTKCNKENILLVFLYINSYIYVRKKDTSSVDASDPANNPEAFWRSLESMAADLSMSKDTLNQCIQYLILPSDSEKPLLVKKEVGSIQPNPTKAPKNLPNIYVLNKDGCQREIEWAFQKILELYHVDSFDEMKNGNRKNSPTLPS